MIKGIRALLFTILLFGNILGFTNDTSEGKDAQPAANTIIVDQNGNGDYNTIREALENAESGDTIRIWNGIYEENILIQKSIIIVGNGTEKTYIVENSNEYTIKISSTNVFISDVNVSNYGDEYGYYCIDLENAKNVTLVNSSIVNCYIGIHTYRTNNIVIEHCKLLENHNPFYFHGQCSDFDINNNTMLNNYSWGYVNFAFNPDIVFKDNRMYNVSSDMNRGDHLTSMIFDNNSINGRPVLLKIGSEDYDNKIEYSQYFFYKCSNIKIEGIVLDNIHQSISIWDCENIQIFNSSISNSNISIDISGSSNITIYNNSFYNNYRAVYGWYVDNSTIENCSFFNNERGIDTTSSEFILIKRNKVIDSKYIAIRQYGKEAIISDNYFIKCNSGVELNSKNSLVENNNFETINNFGIYSNNIIIINNNTIINATNGIEIFSTDNIPIIIQNTAIRNCETGIKSYCHGCLINNVSISNASLYGLDLRRVEYVSNSTLINCSNIACYFNETKNCRFFSNIIKNNRIGVFTSDTVDNYIYHNWFLFNQNTVFGNSQYDKWNRPLPIGGNYWSDYIGKDVKKGFAQDEPGSDGFGDTPYIEGLVRDNYPIYIDIIKPYAYAGSDVTIGLGTIYHFDSTNSHDDQFIERSIWEWNYSGEYKRIELKEFDFKFDEIGKYLVNLTVFDFAGNFDKDSINITVIDQESPVAISQGNITINQGEIAYLNGTLSTDNDIIINYTWTISEIDEWYVTLYGPSPQLPLENPVQYICNLKVTDRSGNSGYDSFLINVMDIIDPIANAGDDIEIANGETAQFDGSGCIDNYGYYYNFHYNWTFLYANEEIILTGYDPTFTFDIPGYYNVTMTVFDWQGNSDKDSVIVTVEDTIPPITRITGTLTVLEGESLFLSGLSSTDNGKIVKYVWTFNDTAPIKIESPSLEYWFISKGFIDVTLTVFDQWNNSHSTKVRVKILDFNSPIANAGEDRTAIVGETVYFDGSCSSDDGAIIRWSWSFQYSGRYIQLEGEKVNFTFERSGEYNILLTIYDQSNNTGEDNVLITVVGSIDDDETDDDIIEDDDDNTTIDDDTNTDEGSPLIFIVFIVVLLLLFVLVFVWFILLRRKTNKHQITDEQADFSMDGIDDPHRPEEASQPPSAPSEFTEHVSFEVENELIDEDCPIYQEKEE